MRLTFIIGTLIFLTSCNISKSVKSHPYGGEFIVNNLNQKNSKELQLLSFNRVEPSQNYEMLSNGVSKLEKISQRIMQIQMSINDSLKIDSLPPDSLMNDADKQLLKADEYIKKFYSQKRTARENAAVYLTVSTPVGIWYANHAYFNDNWLLDGIKYVIVGCVSILWLALLILICRTPNSYKQNAISIIKTAPNFAPDNRKIEYEVRCFEMIYNHIEFSDFDEIISRIRALPHSESDQVWLNKLDLIEANFNSKYHRH